VVCSFWQIIECAVSLRIEIQKGEIHSRAANLAVSIVFCLTHDCVFSCGARLFKFKSRMLRNTDLRRRKLPLGSPLGALAAQREITTVANSCLAVIAGLNWVISIFSSFSINGFYLSQMSHLAAVCM
jgi:hypothetical protein